MLLARVAEPGGVHRDEPVRVAQVGELVAEQVAGFLGERRAGGEQLVQVAAAGDEVVEPLLATVTGGLYPGDPHAAPRDSRNRPSRGTRAHLRVAVRVASRKRGRRRGR